MLKMDGESYIHAAARHLLVEWLRETAAQDGCVSLHGVNGATTNRGAPTYGVFPEYPLCTDPDSSEWCSSFISADEMYPTLKAGEGWSEETLTLLDYSYEELCSLGWAPWAILDIGVIHKGNLRFGIEIVHKLPITPQKMQKLLRPPCPHTFFELYTVNALDILKQTKPPQDFRPLVRRII